MLSQWQITILVTNVKFFNTKDFKVFPLHVSVNYNAKCSSPSYGFPKGGRGACPRRTDRGCIIRTACGGITGAWLPEGTIPDGAEERGPLAGTLLSAPFWGTCDFGPSLDNAFAVPGGGGWEFVVGKPPGKGPGFPCKAGPDIGWPSGRKGGPVDAGNPNIPGGSISWTTTGSFPWSKGQSSPRIQNPFSVEMKTGIKNTIKY